MKDLRLLEFAVALGHHRHFARAAAAMGVTQPTLSRGIARLEREVGETLFERTTRSVQPTNLGLAFLERAESLLQGAARLSDLRDTDAGLLSGQLNVGAGPYPLELSVLPAVASLAATHPRLRIRVVEGAWRQFPEMLLHGAVDVVVIHASMFASDSRVEVEMLPSHRGRLVCRAGHPLTRKRRVTEADIEAYPLVNVSMVGNASRQLDADLRVFAKKFSVDPRTGDMNPPIVTSSGYAAREIIKHGDGLGLFTEPQVREDVAAGRLAMLETGFPVPSTGYAIVWPRSRTLTPAARDFIECVRAAEAELAGRVRRPRARSAPGDRR